MYSRDWSSDVCSSDLAQAASTLTRTGVSCLQTGRCRRPCLRLPARQTSVKARATGLLICNSTDCRNNSSISFRLWIPPIAFQTSPFIQHRTQSSGPLSISTRSQDAPLSGVPARLIATDHPRLWRAVIKISNLLFELRSHFLQYRPSSQEILSVDFTSSLLLLHEEDQSTSSIPKLRKSRLAWCWLNLLQRISLLRMSTS